MSTTAETAAESGRRITYGNWVEQRSAGIGSAGLVGTAVLMGGLIVVMLTMLFAGLTAALVMLLMVAVVFTLTGTPVGKRLARRIGFARAKAAGEHQWRSGVFSKNPPNATRLPGMLGRLSLIEKADPFGTPFAVVKNPIKGLYTIVAKCVPDGPWMEDQDRLNAWVGNYSGVLSACGQEPALVAAKAIVDTAPDPGGRLASMVNDLTVDGAPAIAKQVMAECVENYPLTSSENTTYFELTFSGRGLHRKGEEKAVLAELSRRVPALLAQLGAAGGGSVRMVTADELPGIVHVAYDPLAQPFIEQAALSGAKSPITMADAGPVASQEYWDRFVHDSGVSITWEMFGAPRAAITELAIAALVGPHRDFTRKRVALVYRPQSPDKSVTVSENDANTARFLASQSKKRTTALASLRMAATDKSRQEVASGAVMVPFSLLVTATVTDADDVDQAASTLKSRAGAVPVRLRRTNGSQAAAFATTLPLGFVPWEHTVIPAHIREWM